MYLVSPVIYYAKQSVLKLHCKSYATGNFIMQNLKNEDLQKPSDSHLQLPEK